jgi:hypothetical protein
LRYLPDADKYLIVINIVIPKDFTLFSVIICIYIKNISYLIGQDINERMILR